MRRPIASWYRSTPSTRCRRASPVRGSGRRSANQTPFALDHTACSDTRTGSNSSTRRLTADRCRGSGRVRTPERPADAVKAHRERFANLVQLRKARSTRHHVVFGVNFEPQGGITRRERVLHVGLLETDSGADSAGVECRDRPVDGAWP